MFEHQRLGERCFSQALAPVPDLGLHNQAIQYCIKASKMLLHGSCHCQRVKFSVQSQGPYPYLYCYCRLVPLVLACVACTRLHLCSDVLHKSL